MSTLADPDRSGDLLAREAAVRKREEVLMLRESMLDAMTEFRHTETDELQDHLRDGRDANSQLVIASLRLQALAEAAEAASRRKDEFLAMLSHELRNPLAPMHNVIEMLGRIADAEPRLPWIHGVLKRQTEQLTRLLDDLLDAARVPTGKLVLKRRRIAAQAVIEQAIETCRPMIDAHGQQLSVRLPAEPAWVDGDSARLTQVFTNLLNNASKYTPQGGRIDVSLHVGDTTIEALVADTGCGLPPAALQRIFDLFAQEDQSLADAQGGLGIGLAVVRELVNLHHGSVRATSRGLGLGSVFSVSLPLMAEVVSATHVDPQALQTSPAGLHRLSIVLIEDNVDGNDSIAALLRMAGHTVVSAYDGAAGLALVLAVRPHVMLCDLGLPTLDGLQIAARVRAELVGAPPLLVALTGYGQSGDVERSKAAGFDAHLVKPVDPNALLAMLQRRGVQADAQADGPADGQADKPA